MEQGWEQFLLSRNLPQLENAGKKNHLKKVFPKRKNLAVRMPLKDMHPSAAHVLTTRAQGPIRGTYVQVVQGKAVTAKATLLMYHGGLAAQKIIMELRDPEPLALTTREPGAVI
jgi:hypothetical protein